MVLAKDEKLIEEWNYADSKSGGFFNKVKTHACLTVTNKRIVYSATSKRAVDRQEIPLQAIKTLSFTQSSKGNLWIIVKIFFSAILSLAIIGIPALIKNIKELNQGSFEMEIETEGVSTLSMEIGVAKLFKRKSKAGKVKVAINKAVVGEIIEKLGAIVVENKAAV